MPTYILLSTLSPHGVGTIKANPERLLEVNAEVEQMGAKVVQQWAVLGPYDFVNIVEAPDEKIDRPRLGRARRAGDGALPDAHGHPR